METERKDGRRVLLGGVGGDSHSVGLTILRDALRANGYQVRYLGTQNRLEEIVRAARGTDVAMVSSMDGHGRYYLREFAELRQRPEAQGVLWYLGGNLHIGNGVGYERLFMEMGFDRVFVKFVDVTQVLIHLRQDLDARPRATLPWTNEVEGATPSSSSGLTDERVEPDSFERERREVLQQWKTGRGAADLRANAEFLATQPTFAARQRAVNEGSAPILVQPRSGVPGVEGQVRLFRAFREVGVRVVSYQVDSLTRNNDYAAADEAIRESQATGAATLNGFPVINHGVGALRRICAATGLPIQTRHSTRDPRLLAEISYAGGATAFEGGPICYNIPYYKRYPPEEAVRRWQYVDRLTGIYHERFGVVLDREFFGTLTATLIPPSTAIAIDIVEAALAAQQGVKCVSLGYAESGHRVQDVAAIRVLRELAARTLANLGYADVQVNTVFHQYMAAFPAEPARAEELVYQSGLTAQLTGATRVLTKTPVEAMHIPTLADNLNGITLAMRGAEEGRTRVMDEARVAEEAFWIRREAEAILESVFLCGGGVLAAGVVEGFRRGFLDIPFAPSMYNRGEVSSARDAEGAIRYLSFGQLQVDREVREFHRSRLQERRRLEGTRTATQDYLLVERDVMRVPRLEYERWPLFDGSYPAAAVPVQLVHAAAT